MTDGLSIALDARDNITPLGSVSAEVFAYLRSYLLRKPPLSVE